MMALGRRRRWVERLGVASALGSNDGKGAQRLSFLFFFLFCSSQLSSVSSLFLSRAGMACLWRN
jgi:hypothetical protein